MVKRYVVLSEREGVDMSEEDQVTDGEYYLRGLLQESDNWIEAKDKRIRELEARIDRMRSVAKSNCPKCVDAGYIQDGLELSVRMGDKRIAELEAQVEKMLVGLSQIIH